MMGAGETTHGYLAQLAGGDALKMRTVWVRVPG